jgi:hypothetical protein
MPCVFCGEDQKLSREHVFPRWLKSDTGSGGAERRDAL